MWDQRMGWLAEERLREARAAALQPAPAGAQPRSRRRVRTALGSVLVRWGTRLTAAPAAPVVR